MSKHQLGKCCDTVDDIRHPDHTKELHRINRIAGQVEGVKRMISNREYCPKIITQIQAVRAALKALESIVLENHLASCVRDALGSGDQKESEKKMAELMDLFRRA